MNLRTQVVITPERSEANAANDRGNAAKRESELAVAEAEYLRAIDLSPDFEAPWFNLGIIYKWQCRWADSRRCVERAIELQPDDNEGAYWNLGIAATATGDWVTARRAWRLAGVEIPDGEGPIELNFGLTPIRMRTEDSEVVWCRRIDPARAIIRSIPLPQSRRRYGDLLLHDGSAAGYRTLNGREVPVFDELELLAPSAFNTYTVHVVAPDEAATKELIESFDAVGLGAEDWTGSVRMICRACSEGRPHEHARDATEDGWKPERELGIASIDEASVERVPANWARSGRRGWRRSRTRDFGPLERVTEGAPTA